MNPNKKRLRRTMMFLNAQKTVNTLTQEINF